MACPPICLNMIVRNEAHIIRECLDSVAPYIRSWVIVDTGSDDGTQDVIRDHLAGLGIRGELHERPWRDFGYNRTEALTLAQGHADYIWVMDADDIVVGTPDFAGLNADGYLMRFREESSLAYWRFVLFRDGLRVRYVGAVHEFAECRDGSWVTDRLDGAYHIESRRLGGRNLDARKHERDVALLLREIERDPENARAVFYLAQGYSALGDFANARKWYARRVELGGWAEEVYYAMYRLAWVMNRLGEPWPHVEDVYLRAWEFRPTRAEALYNVAWQHRSERRFQRGYLFARRAAEIGYPTQDVVLVHPDVYAWRAADEQAVCASQIGRHTEAFALFRRLLGQSDIPDDDRRRIAANRDYSVPAMLDATSQYPAGMVAGLVAGPRNAGLTVSIVAGPDRVATELTLNTFLNCCTDLPRGGRFLIIDAGLSAGDRTLLGERYGFVEFIAAPAADPGTALAHIGNQIGGRFWLQLGQGWRFFAPENLITRLTAVLEAEPQLFQVGVNFGDAAVLTGTCASEAMVRHTPGAGRYVLTDAVATGPAMFDTTRLDRIGGIGGAARDQSTTLAQRAAAAGLSTASLDEVLCISAP